MGLTTHKSARVLVVQYAGDYREAFLRLSKGGPEFFQSQRYSINYAGQLAERFDAYGVLCITGPDAYFEPMSNGVIACSSGQTAPSCIPSKALELIERFKPTHLVLTTPEPMILEYALRRGIDLLPAFADTFRKMHFEFSSIRTLVRSVRWALYLRRLSKILTDSRIRWMGNHNVSASRSMLQLGITAKKIVPWDWPRLDTPSTHGPKIISHSLNVWSLVMVGSLCEQKGVGDAITATSILRKEGHPATLTVVGLGDLDRFRKQVILCGMEDFVQFAGQLPHERVIEVFRSGHLALVPSWYEYAEGVPGTIYEAFATRTPVVCTDHPGFREQVIRGNAAVCVPEKSPQLIAEAVKMLLLDDSLYFKMSVAAEFAWKQLSCPVTFYDLVERWVSATHDDDSWLQGFSLSSGYYA